MIDFREPKRIYSLAAFMIAGVAIVAFSFASPPPPNPSNVANEPFNNNSVDADYTQLSSSNILSVDQPNQISFEVPGSWQQFEYQKFQSDPSVRLIQVRSPKVKIDNLDTNTVVRDGAIIEFSQFKNTDYQTTQSYAKNFDNSAEDKKDVKVDDNIMAIQYSPDHDADETASPKIITTFIDNGTQYTISLIYPENTLNTYLPIYNNALKSFKKETWKNWVANQKNKYLLLQC